MSLVTVYSHFTELRNIPGLASSGVHATIHGSTVVFTLGMGWAFVVVAIVNSCLCCCVPSLGGRRTDYMCSFRLYSPPMKHAPCSLALLIRSLFVAPCFHPSIIHRQQPSTNSRFTLVQLFSKRLLSARCCSVLFCSVGFCK